MPVSRLAIVLGLVLVSSGCLGDPGVATSSAAIADDTSEVTAVGDIIAGNVEITGSLRVRSPRTRFTPASMASPDALRDPYGSQFIIGNSRQPVVFPLLIDYASTSSITRISRWSLRIYTSSGAGTLTAQMYARNALTGLETAIGPVRQLVNVAVGPTAMTVTGLALDTQPADHDQFYVAFVGGGHVGEIVYHLEYDLTDQ